MSAPHRRPRGVVAPPADAAPAADPAPPAAATRFVEVALPLPVDHPFTYHYGPSDAAAGMPEPRVGARVTVPVGRRTVNGVIIALRPTAPPGVKTKALSRVVDAVPLIDDEYLTFARWVAATYLSPLGETLAAMLPGGAEPRELPAASGEEPIADPQRITLSSEQQHAIETVRRPTAARPEAWYYLYGITGSGKTEVFLRLAERTLAEGRSVLYLVPEIALTHQLFAHISARFGAVAAMLHSGVTRSRRLGEWRRIAEGTARLVVGARSAVFAPLRDLGLVVIDEEHEGSYKAGSAPRYHARSVAMWRAVREGAACVMGSATPSVEAWHLMETGRLTRLDLTRRLAGGAMPAVRVVDVRGRPDLLSPPLVEALAATKAAGAQSILFLNRRGFAPTFRCASCGWSHECDSCSVPMTWHKQRGRLVCHYCGARARPPSVCPACGSLDLGFSGFGTERIEEEIGRALPHLTVERLDADTTARRGALAGILDRFAGGETDLLVGTQMVAKGLNFPGVRTVGIVMADVGLSLPDFRAAERTFALITQVAGRAGRFRADGEVIVQTLRPDHDAIRLAVSGDSVAFYRGELATREVLGYPPFSRLVRMLVRAPSEGEAESLMGEIAADLRAAIGSAPGATILGPAPAPLERIKKHWRHHLLIRTPAVAPVRDAIRAAVSGRRLPHGAHLEIDVDPANLL